jgi:transposase
MARALSVDLRLRVVGAVEVGLSCRAAAERFGVSASSAIRWRAQEQREGDVRPKLQGGDRHSHRIEAHAELILSALAAKSDIIPVPADADSRRGFPNRLKLEASKNLAICGDF